NAGGARSPLAVSDRVRHPLMAGVHLDRLVAPGVFNPRVCKSHLRIGAARPEAPTHPYGQARLESMTVQSPNCMDKGTKYVHRSGQREVGTGAQVQIVDA